MLQIILDGTLASLAVLLAYFIRFDGLLAPAYIHQFTVVAPAFVALRLLANWACGVYRRLWRYTGLTEITELGCSVLIVTTLIMIARAFGGIAIDGAQLSYGVIAIEMGLAFTLLAGPRVLRRLQIEHSQRRHWRQPVRRRALLVGAGDAGQMVAKELAHRRDLGVDIVGLIDDDPQKLHRRIGHLTVFGTTGDLPRLVEDLVIDQ